MRRLNELENERILKVRLNRDTKSAVFTEMCDEHFGITLTKEQVIELAAELLTLANEHMED